MRNNGVKVLLAGLMGLLFWANPMEVEAQDYIWRNDRFYTGNPIASVSELTPVDYPEAVTAEDNIYLYDVPDETCLEWFRNLSGECDSLDIVDNHEINIEIGNGENSLNIRSFYFGNEGTCIVNADCYYVDCTRGNLTINGDVNTVRAGDGYTTEESSPNDVKHVYNGNVNKFEWHKSVSESAAEEGKYYAGFAGSCVVTGKVRSGEIIEAIYDPNVRQEVYVTTYAIGACDAGIFQIDKGVISEQVPLEKKEVNQDNFTYEYDCYGSSGYGNIWLVSVYDAESGDFSHSITNWKWEDVPVGANVRIYSTGTPVVVDKNVANLYMRGGEATINEGITVDQLDISGGSVVSAGSTPSVKVESYANQIDATLTGTISEMSIITPLPDEVNLTVNGEVTKGQLLREENFHTHPEGYFSCDNTQLIANGVWNPDVVIYTSENQSTAIAYYPVSEQELNSALTGQGIGTVSNTTDIFGEAITVVKDARVSVMESSAEEVEILSQSGAFLEAINELSATPICSMDIEVETFYKNTETGEHFENEAYSTKMITQLPNPLTFKVKIPDAYYRENVNYKIIGMHTGETGRQSARVLGTMQDGNEITFVSDKFSTFVIVEAAEEDSQLEAFVDRMYTVALGRDSEGKGLLYWKDKLVNGENDGAGIARGFFLSPEFVGKSLSDSEYVNTLYSTFFDRVPVAEEVSYWTNILATGNSRELVLAGFVNSNEFDALCNSYGISRGFLRQNGEAINPGISQFAERLYTKVLERAGEKEGIEFWTLQIADKVCTPAEAAHSFFLSKEYLDRNTTDVEYIQALYRTFMDREAEESGLTYYQNVLNNGASRDEILGGFANSEEFQGIMAEFGL